VTPLALVVPGAIDTRTGGYEYDRRIAAGLRARGRRVDIIELAGRLPDPSDAAIADADRIFAEIPDRTTVLIDGLALSAIPVVIEREARRLRLVALVHMPIGEESGLEPALAARLEAAEHRALEAASLIVATGERTIESLARSGLPLERLALVEPGTDPAPLARGSIDPSIVHLACVATIGPGKGHDVLLATVAALPSHGWRLTCAGNLDRDPATADALRETIRLQRLSDRVSLAGELDREALASLYDSADVFVLATRHESYGMAVAEALSRGLPIVSTTTGAIPTLVGDDAGILVAPGDADAFARALAAVVTDRTLRATLAKGARRVRQRLPTWDSAAAAMDAVIDQSGESQSEITKSEINLNSEV
jgi:glycosyltransferase involved in cell wall biosynthesis